MKRIDFKISYQVNNSIYSQISYWLMQLTEKEQREKIHEALFNFWGTFAKVKFLPENYLFSEILEFYYSNRTSLLHQINQIKEQKIEPKLAITDDLIFWEHPLIFRYRKSIKAETQLGNFYRYLHEKVHQEKMLELYFFHPVQSYWEWLAIKTLEPENTALIQQTVNKNIQQLNQQIRNIEEFCQFLRSPPDAKNTRITNSLSTHPSTSDSNLALEEQESKKQEGQKRPLRTIEVNFN